MGNQTNLLDPRCRPYGGNGPIPFALVLGTSIQPGPVQSGHVLQTIPLQLPIFLWRAFRSGDEMQIHP